MSFLSARLNCGMTQKEAADKLSLDQSAVSLWENGKNMPRAALLPAIARLYNTTVDELLEEVELCTATTTESSSASATESC